MVESTTGDMVTNQTSAAAADGGTAPRATKGTDFAEYVLDETSKYKIPKDHKFFDDKGNFVPPADLDKAVRSKQEHIRRLEEENSQLRQGVQSNEILQKLEQLLTSGGKSEPSDPEPNAVLEPEKHTQWVIRQAGNVAAERGREEVINERNRFASLHLSAELFKDHGETAKQDEMKLWDRLLRTGDAVIMKDAKGNPLKDTNGIVILKVHPDRVRAAYRDIYWDRAISEAKKQGLKDTQETIGKATSAPGSVSGSEMGDTNVDYNSLSETERAKYREMVSAQIPLPQRNK